MASDHHETQRALLSTLDQCSGEIRQARSELNRFYLQLRELRDTHPTPLVPPQERERVLGLQEVTQALRALLTRYEQIDNLCGLVREKLQAVAEASV